MLVGLIVSCVLAGGIAIFVTHGAREMVRTTLELAAALSFVVAWVAVLFFMTGGIGH